MVKLKWRVLQTARCNDCWNHWRIAQEKPKGLGRRGVDHFTITTITDRAHSRAFQVKTASRDVEVISFPLLFRLTKRPSERISDRRASRARPWRKGACRRPVNDRSSDPGPIVVRPSESQSRPLIAARLTLSKAAAKVPGGCEASSREDRPARRIPSPPTREIVHARGRLSSIRLSPTRRTLK